MLRLPGSKQVAKCERSKGLKFHGPKLNNRIVNFDAQIANRNRSDLKSQSTSEMATKVASKSVEKSVEIAAEIAVIQIAAISIASELDLITSDLGIYENL